jgi:hypothetical protein
MFDVARNLQDRGASKEERVLPDLDISVFDLIIGTARVVVSWENCGVNFELLMYLRMLFTNTPNAVHALVSWYRYVQG